MVENLHVLHAHNALNISGSTLPKSIETVLLTYQLQVLASDRSLLEKAINDVDCEEQCVWQQLEFLVDLHEPVNENGPHLCVDVSLLQAETTINKSCMGRGLFIC